VTTIDVHMHLAGTGCCQSGCWVSPGFRRRHTFRLLKLIHRITDEQMRTTADQDWATRIAATIAGSGVDYGVVLGFDGVYHKDHGAFDEAHSQLIVPPEWVFKVCREHKNLLPGPSINPYRADALERLDYCIEHGAVLIKWLPAAQSIDPADRKMGPFYARCAAAKLPLLIHMGGERTFKTVTAEFNNVERLREPLEAGVPVICAHTATRILGTDEPDQIPALKALLKEYPHLWVDNSGLCNPSRFAHVPKLAADPEITARTLYGSDYPVPANAFYYLGKLGPRKVWELERTANVVDRDVAIKRAFGYPEATLTRATRVLAHLDRWGVTGA
jgi:predicted TIM-barrel fold metal-dependent hydrolase